MKGPPPPLWLIQTQGFILAITSCLCRTSAVSVRFPYQASFTLRTCFSSSSLHFLPRFNHEHLRPLLFSCLSLLSHDAPAIRTTAIPQHCWWFSSGHERTTFERRKGSSGSNRTGGGDVLWSKSLLFSTMWGLPASNVSQELFHFHRQTPNRTEGGSNTRKHRKTSQYRATPTSSKASSASNTEEHRGTPSNTEERRGTPSNTEHLLSKQHRATQRNAEQHRGTLSNTDQHRATASFWN